MSIKPATEEVNTQGQSRFMVLFDRFGIELVLLMMIIISALVAPSFIKPSNLISVLRQISITAPIAIAMTFIIINGNIDLSVGGIVGLAGMVSVLLDAKGAPLIVVILAAFAISIVAGIINAASVYAGLAPFIVTMSTNLILRGICYMMTNGQPVWGVSKSYTVIGQGFIGPIPNPVIIFIAIFLIAYFVLHHTTIGRNVYAVGGNWEASRLSGISVLKSKIFVFCVSGVLSAVTGIVLSSRLASCDPTIGIDFQVDAIAATVIGGTSMSGGEGRVSKTIIGILIIGILSNILNLAGISPYVQQVVKGVIIFAAVLWDNWKRKKRG